MLTARRNHSGASVRPAASSSRGTRTAAPPGAPPSAPTGQTDQTDDHQTLHCCHAGGAVSAAQGASRSVTASPAAARSTSTSCSGPGPTLSPAVPAVPWHRRDKFGGTVFNFVSFVTFLTMTRLVHPKYPLQKCKELPVSSYFQIKSLSIFLYFQSFRVNIVLRGNKSSPKN